VSTALSLLEPGATAETGFAGRIKPPLQQRRRVRSRRARLLHM